MPFYSQYCEAMGNHYDSLAHLTEKIIEKLTDVINGIYSFEDACSGLYETVLARLAVVERIYTSFESSDCASFTISPDLQKTLDDIKRRLLEQKLDAMFKAGKITLVGDGATEWIDIDREEICTRGIEMVDSEKMPEDLGKDSCAWFCSKVYMECGDIAKEGSYATGDYATGWYENSYNYINSEGLYTYFEGKPYTTVYKISGTATEKEAELVALRNSGKYHDGDLLFFDKEGDKAPAENGGGIKDHVVILNGTYSSDGAAVCDSQNFQIPREYNGTTAFFGQNDNHYSYSVQASLEHTKVNGVNAYSDDTDLYVVAFNG